MGQLMVENRNRHQKDWFTFILAPSTMADRNHQTVNHYSKLEVLVVANVFPPQVALTQEILVVLVLKIVVKFIMLDIVM